MRKRKTRKVVWIIFHHGTGSTNVTIDLQSAWHTRRAAQHEIAASATPERYTAEKYVRVAK